MSNLLLRGSLAAYGFRADLSRRHLRVGVRAAFENCDQPIGTHQKRAGEGGSEIIHRLPYARASVSHVQQDKHAESVQ